MGLVNQAGGLALLAVLVKPRLLATIVLILNITAEVLFAGPARWLSGLRTLSDLESNSYSSHEVEERTDPTVVL